MNGEVAEPLGLLVGYPAIPVEWIADGALGYAAGGSGGVAIHLDANGDTDADADDILAHAVGG